MGARQRHTAWEQTDDDSDDSDSEQEYQVVRGRDGRLYYVKNPVYRRPQKSSNDDDFELVRGPDGRLHAVRKTNMDSDDDDRMGVEPSQPVKKNKKSKSVSKKNKKNKLWNSLRRTRSSDDMDTDDERPTIQEVTKDVVEDSTHPDTDTEGEYDNSTSSSISRNNNNVVMQSPPEKKKKPKRKRVTIIVEDASDSEYEDDDYNSPWRNRRPSPGQWMEPVENYQ